MTNKTKYARAKDLARLADEVERLFGLVASLADTMNGGTDLLRNVNKAVAQALEPIAAMNAMNVLADRDRRAADGETVNH